jgi:serine/threonine protein kinase
MEAAFQDKNRLYMVLDLMPGGNLRSFLQENKSVSELQTSKIKEMY